MKRFLTLGTSLATIAFSAADEGSAGASVEDTGRKAITIQGVEFEILQPYSEGHTCTAAEAQALNQTRSEAIRNNTAAKVKAQLKLAGTSLFEGKEVQIALTDEVLLELNLVIGAYDAEYQFTLASVGGGRASRDPIEVEATRIAKASVASSLKSQGRTLKSITHDGENVIEGGAEKLAAAIATVAARPEVVQAARETIEQRNKLASADITALAL